MAYGDSMNFQ